MDFKDDFSADYAFREIARSIAKIAHHGAVDKSGDEYFQHPLRVAEMVKKEMPGNTIAAAAAYLHDVLEDTEWTETNIREMFAAFPKESVDKLINAVVLLTRTKDNVETYYEDIKKNEVALVVKLCDIRDNTDPTRLAKLSDENQIRLIKKYSKAKEKLS